MKNSAYVLVATMFLCCCGVHARSSDDIADRLQETRRAVTTSNYKDLLLFLNKAYDKSASDNTGLQEYWFLAALTQVPAAEQLDVAIDFALTKPRLSLKTEAADIIKRAVYGEGAITPAQEERARKVLKEQLSSFSEKGSYAYLFAERAAEALVALGDDAGLDVWLTTDTTSSNYSVADGWDETSPASLFDNLVQRYATDAKSSNRAAAMFKASLYKLCQARREHGTEIKPIRPIINLSTL